MTVNKAKGGAPADGNGNENANVADAHFEVDSLAEESTHGHRQASRYARTADGDTPFADAAVGTNRGTAGSAVSCTVGGEAVETAVAVAPPPPRTKWQMIRSNRNVLGVLVFCFIDGGAFSIWNQQVFQVLVKNLGDDTDVGWMSAASGVTQMIAAVGAAFIGKHFLHESVLRVGALAGFSAVLLTVLGVFQLKLSTFYVSQAFWGAYSGIVATSTEAIFADSVATGRRTFIYNVKWMDQTMSSVIGLTIAIILLASMGNTWEQSSIIKTMYGGLLLHPLAMLTLFTLHDRYSLKEEDDNDAVEDGSGGGAGGQGAGKGCSLEATDWGRVGCTPEGDTPSALAADPQATARYKVIAVDQRGKWGRMRANDSQQCLSSVGAALGAQEDDRLRDDEGLDPAAAAAAEAAPKHGDDPNPDVSFAVHGVHPDAADTPSGASDSQKGKQSSSSANEVLASPCAPATPSGKTVAFLSGTPTTTDGNIGANHRGRYDDDGMPRGCGEKALIKYLNNQAARENEAFRSEQNELRKQPLKWLANGIHYGWHIAFTWETVPFFVCLVDFLVAFASGISMRFLNLYFIVDRGTSPALLMTANLIVCPLQAFFSYLVQICGSLYVGRITSTIGFRLVGTVLMLIMGLSDLPLWILIPIFIVRNALMNSTRGVTRSVIMDAVKKQNRAKWSAFESFSSFTWAGSATIGGYVAQAKGYKFSFTLTALMHFVALAVLVPAAFGSFPVEREMMREEREKLAAKKAARNGGSGTMPAGDVAIVESN